jgi:hypothetical protein
MQCILNKLFVNAQTLYGYGTIWGVGSNELIMNDGIRITYNNSPIHNSPKLLAS